jgi:hypothetical protein
LYDATSRDPAVPPACPPQPVTLTTRLLQARGFRHTPARTASPAEVAHAGLQHIAARPACARLQPSLLKGRGSHGTGQLHPGVAGLRLLLTQQVLMQSLHAGLRQRRCTQLAERGGRLRARRAGAPGRGGCCAALRAAASARRAASMAAALPSTAASAASCAAVRASSSSIARLRSLRAPSQAAPLYSFIPLQTSPPAESSPGLACSRG